MKSSLNDAKTRSHEQKSIIFLRRNKDVNAYFERVFDKRLLAKPYSEGSEVKAHGATQNLHHAVGYASNLKYSASIRDFEQAPRQKIDKKAPST
ncbi:hypothetical protein [Candidatus Regiella insecticola]|uniref:hypothetical protein n=1 Tax=Candidatus Regiella insecticola TaxID=138073 RepID=UPI001596D453|nr:hypothetical protein [Candidatus Regiella insecticola]